MVLPKHSWSKYFILTLTTCKTLKKQISKVKSSSGSKLLNSLLHFWNRRSSSEYISIIKSWKECCKCRSARRESCSHTGSQDGDKCRSSPRCLGALKDLKLKQARWERLSVEKCFTWFSTSHSFMGEWQQESKSFPEFQPRPPRACLEAASRRERLAYRLEVRSQKLMVGVTITFLVAGVELRSIKQGSAPAKAKEDPVKLLSPDPSFISLA